MIVRTDVLIASVLHKKALRNCSELNKAELFIKVTSRSVGLYNRIELQNLKAAIFSLLKASLTSISPIPFPLDDELTA